MNTIDNPQRVAANKAMRPTKKMKEEL